MRALLVSLIIVFVQNVSAQEASLKYGFTAEQNKEMSDHNKLIGKFQTENPTFFSDTNNPLSFHLLDQTAVRAFAEYEQAKYLIFSAAYDFGSKQAKLKMAEKLPQDMTLVIFTGSIKKEAADSIRADFEEVIDPSRLKVVHMPQGQKGFWARDGVPVPVMRKTVQGEDFFTVVDARYYHKFEADKNFSELFNAELTQHTYYYEGGNFMANSKNECLIVNKQATSIIPDSIFEKHYGCNKLVRLPHVKGIGHADESVKFIDDDTVFTDEPSYVKQLKDNGFDVVMLPRPEREYETYVNSLIVNGTVFVPIFDEKKDESALQIYRDAGFKEVIGVNSSTLSNNGLGSLHCITMTYPDVPMNELLKSMGGSLL